MASIVKNQEVSKSMQQNVQYEILDDKSAAKSGLDVLHTTQIDHSPTEDVEKKILLLKHLLEKDPKAADLKWSLFVAASNTYRYDSCLKPFPPMYIKNECKDIEALVLSLIFVRQYVIFSDLLPFFFFTEKSY